MEGVFTSDIPEAFAEEGIGVGSDALQDDQSFDSDDSLIDSFQAVDVADDDFEEYSPDLPGRMEEEAELSADEYFPSPSLTAATETEGRDAFEELSAVPEEAELFVDDSAELETLQASVETFGAAVDESNLNILYSEIARLRHRWIDQYERKMFLQLLSTVAQNLHTGDSDHQKEGVQLLEAISDKLNQLCSSALKGEQKGQLLFEETSKVLFWQQTQIVPLQDRSEPVVEKEDHPEIDDQAESDIIEPEDGLHFSNLQSSQEGENVTEVVRQEIRELREAMQGELEELRKQIAGK